MQLLDVRNGVMYDLPCPVCVEYFEREIAYIQYDIVTSGVIRWNIHYVPHNKYPAV